MELGRDYCIANKWVITYKAGKGKAGGAVYGARDGRGEMRCAIKYPLRDSEVEAINATVDEQGMPRGIGIPRILDRGTHWGHTYVAMELLGAPVAEIFKKFQGSIAVRWEALRVLARLMVRRLEALHRCGFVHCDVQPANILMGRSEEDSDVAERARASSRPFLIDFGCAQPFPGGGAKRADFGSVDFNSIRTAEGGPRGPCDDLEALGWVLCHGLFGNLPWFQYTKQARWRHGKLDEAQRPKVCGQVSQAKAALLDSGHTSFGPEWKHLAQMPLDLAEFLRRCGRRAESYESDDICDYSEFIRLLGGGDIDVLHPEMADEEDMQLFQRNAAAAAASRPPEVPAAADAKAVAEGSDAEPGGSSPGSTEASAVEGADNGDGLQRWRAHASARQQTPVEAAEELLQSEGNDDAQAPDQADDEPNGTWVYNGGKSFYKISTSLSVDGWYEQPLASGRVLCGELEEMQPGGERAPGSWRWQVTLQNGGLLRLRREGPDMVTSYRKCSTGKWCEPRHARRSSEDEFITQFTSMCG